MHPYRDSIEATLRGNDDDPGPTRNKREPRGRTNVQRHDPTTGQKAPSNSRHLQEKPGVERTQSDHIGENGGLVYNTGMYAEATANRRNEPAEEPHHQSTADATNSANSVFTQDELVLSNRVGGPFAPRPETTVT